MFLSREIDIKLCQIFTKIHLYAILYKSWSIKQIIFNKYAMNLKTTISHRSLRISGFLILYFFFYFAFIIDVIDNTFTYSPYSPYYVTITAANDSVVLLSRGTDGNHQYSALPLTETGDVIRTIWIKCNNIINYIYKKCKIKINNYNRSKSKIFSGQKT